MWKYQGEKASVKVSVSARHTVILGAKEKYSHKHTQNAFV